MQHTKLLFEGEKADIFEEVRTVVLDPVTWLNQPNDQLGGKRPQDLLDQGDEDAVRDLIRSIRHGMPT